MYIVFKCIVPCHHQSRLLEAFSTAHAPFELSPTHPSAQSADQHKIKTRESLCLTRILFSSSHQLLLLPSMTTSLLHSSRQEVMAALHSILNLLTPRRLSLVTRLPKPRHTLKLDTNLILTPTSRLIQSPWALRQCTLVLLQFKWFALIVRIK